MAFQISTEKVFAEICYKHNFVLKYSEEWYSTTLRYKNSGILVLNCRAKNVQEKEEFELGTMIESLKLIADKDWKTPPELAKYPLLIVRASAAFNSNYTVESLRRLYGYLKERVSLRSFDEMTAQDFLRAVQPVNLLREAS